jgi:hypothetical protein
MRARGKNGGPLVAAGFDGTLEGLKGEEGARWCAVTSAATWRMKHVLVHDEVDRDERLLAR